MFFKGTKKRPGAKIAKEVEFSVATSTLSQALTLPVIILTLLAQLSTCVDILCDMACRPSFLEKDFPAERVCSRRI